MNGFVAKCHRQDRVVLRDKLTCFINFYGISLQKEKCRISTALSFQVLTLIILAQSGPLIPRVETVWKKYNF